MSNDELSKQDIVRIIADDPALRELLRAAEGSRPDDIKQVVEMLNKLNSLNSD